MDAVIGEKGMGQPRAFLANSDTSNLARYRSLLEKTMKVFCAKKK